MGATPEEIRNILQNFRWIDDIPEDQVKRDEICLQGKVALLLEANIDSEMMPAFLRLDRALDHYDLPQPISFTLSDGYDKNRDTIVTLQSFEFGNLNEFKKLWGPYATLMPQSYSLRQFIFDARLKTPSYLFTPITPIPPTTGDIKFNFYRYYPSFYSICKGISPYKEPGQMCRFWGCSADPFEKIKVRNMRPDYIWGNQALPEFTQPEPWTDARKEQHLFLNHLIPCQSPLLEPIALKNRYYDNWYCHVFPFHNQYGETIINLLKVYDPETQYKYLVPVSTWIRNNSPTSQIFCVPYPNEKTPLYNLDRLLNPNCHTVILCDSVELADANQHAIESGEIVFTSFLCSPGKYEQVDWSPLQDKELFMLVSNHSGVMLETAALKAKALRDYLYEEQELLPTLVVVPVDYGKKRHRDFDSVDDILTRFNNDPPTIDNDDVRIIETEREVEKFFQSAEKKLNELPDKWWKGQNVAPEEQRIVEEQKDRPKPIDFVLNPLLVRKEVTMLYAQKGAGKSNLAYSIAARVVAAGFSAKPVPLLKEKWWTVPKGRYKVLYLDFENMGEMENKKREFQDGYFPVGKENECRANLIMKDLSQAGTDFSAPENHQKLLDMLEDARKNDGIPDKPVDLLVIDTYTAFVRTETPATPANFKDLINKIRNMNIAVLVVHHANSENEARGLSSKLDSLFLTVNLSCDPEAPDGDLNEQPRIITYENPRGPMNSKLRAPFKILFDREKKHWKLDEGYPRNENAELALIVAEYKKHEYDRDAICEMLGLEKSALSARLKQVKEIK